MFLERHLPRKLRARFTLLALGCAGLVFLCIASLTLWQGRQLLLARRVHDLQARLDEAVGKSDSEMRAIRQEALSMTDVIQLWNPRGLDPWYELLESALHRLPKVHGMRLEFQSDSVFGPREVRSLGVSRVGAGLLRQSRPRQAPPPRLPGDLTPWYWSESPQGPDDQGLPLMACTLPITRVEQGHGVLDGVLVVEIAPETILDSLNDLELGSEYQVFMLDAQRRLVAAAHGGPGSTNGNASTLEWVRSNPDALKSLLPAEAPERFGEWFISESPFSGMKSHFLFVTLPHNPALFVYAVPVRNLKTGLGWLTASVLLLSLLGMAGMGGLIRWSAGRVTRNLDVLSQGVQNVRSGNLLTRLPTPSGQDETAEVITAFNGMVGELQSAFLRAEEMARGQQRLATELELARSIQNSVLPRPIAPLGASLHSFTLPAQEVGGDFFDHFLLPDGRTALVVGDVSGKGISAAMFMMRVSLLLRSSVVGQELPDAVAQVNAMLSDSNAQMMFVTVFLAILDPLTQSLQCVNAGHNPPLLLRADGSVESLARRSGPALGVLPGTRFSAWQTALREDDLLVVYTDGISEAPSSSGEQFGMERLQACLLQHRSQGLPSCAQALVAQTLDWQRSQERFDDITLSLLRAGGPVRALRLPASLDTIEEAVALVEAGAGEGGMEAAAVQEMGLAACEAVTNVITHALHEDAGRSYGLFAAWAGDQFIVRIEDPGPPFDPSALPPVDIQASLEDRPIGGLGWLLIRKATDAISMDRVSETNILTLVRSRHRPTMGQLAKDHPA